MSTLSTRHMVWSITADTNAMFFKDRSSQVYFMERPRRLIITGQSGIGKKEYLEEIAAQSYVDSERERKPIKVFHIGDEMYREADRQHARIEEGKILNLPLSTLNSIRRSVFRDVIQYARKNLHENIIVNTHACFRWIRGLFPAFNMDQIREFDPDFFVTLIDDVDAVYARLSNGKDTHAEQFSFKDIMVWREEEINTSEMLAQVLERRHYVIVLKNPIDTIHKLMFQPELKKAYLSFPMTFAMDKPALWKRIIEFKERMAAMHVVFDPGAIGERRLLLGLPEEGKIEPTSTEVVTFNTLGKERPFLTRDLHSIRKDIDGQIVSRDYKLIEQSDMVIALVPEIQGGDPVISAGSQSELQYARDLTREVYVIWLPAKPPALWVKEMTRGCGQVFTGEDPITTAEQFFLEQRRRVG